MASNKKQFIEAYQTNMQRHLGIALSYISMAAKAAINIAYVPAVLHFLTKEQYGLYITIWSAVSTLSMLDIGFMPTVTRYISAALAENNKDKLKQLIKNFCSLYTAIVCAILLCGGLLYLFIPQTYAAKLSAAEIHTAQTIALFMTATVAFSIGQSFFMAIIMAFEHFIFLRLVQLAYILLPPIMIIFALSFSKQVVAIVITEALCTAGTFLIYHCYCAKKLEIKLMPQLKFTKQALALIKFSFYILLSRISDFMLWNGGQIILGLASSTSQVTFYSVSFLVTYAIFTIPAMITEVYFPAFSAAAQKGGINEVNILINKVGRWQFRLAIMLISGFLLLGKEFIHIWLGADFAMAYKIILAMLVGYTIDAIMNPYINAVQALNKHKTRSVIVFISSCCALILEILLSTKFGAIGCAIALSICVLLGNGITAGIYYTKTGLNVKDYLTDLLKPALSALAAYTCAYLFFKILPANYGIAHFIMRDFIFVLIYCYFEIKLSLNKQEEAQLLAYYAKIKNILANLTKIQASST